MIRTEKIQLLIFINLVLIFFSGKIFSQKETQIHLEQANELSYDKKIGKDIRRLIGEVILRQDSTYLYCDSAYLDDNSNNVKSFGNVRIKDSDTLNLYGDFLKYNGNTKIAEMHNNVKLVDNRATLFTDDLNFDRNTKIANYYNGGKIIDEKNELTSIKGDYHTNEKEFYFKKNVIVKNSDYILNSDTLKYNTISKIVYILGPSTLVGEGNNIYCEDGWYNTNSERTLLKKNACIKKEEHTIRADSIFFDSKNKLGKAYQNICLTDTVQKIILKGNYLYFNDSLRYNFITDKALAILYSNDSLFLHADTLKSVIDSSKKIKYFYAYNKLKFFSKDIQGKCDSLIYKVEDSTITLFHEPIIWTEENQLTADSIKLKIVEKQIRTMSLFNSAFIISQDDSVKFNQIKGKNMKAFFENNKMHKINVMGNSQTIYFLREEDGSLLGINKSESSKMTILLSDNKVQNIKYFESPEANLYPEKDLSPKEILLKNFIWLDKFRPKNKKDIFIKDKKE